MRTVACVIVLVLCALVEPVSAEVRASAENGFHVQRKLLIKAPPETIWRALVSHVGEWWNDDHTFSANARNLYIEAKALGCFCEKMPGDGVVVHLVVTFVNPGEMIRLTGGLGPLGLMGVDGNMTIALQAGDEFTTVVLDYQVGGYSPEGLDQIAPVVDSVLAEQIARLRLFVETGSPE